MRLRKGTASVWIFATTMLAVIAVYAIVGVAGPGSDRVELREETYQRRASQAASEIFEDGLWEDAARIAAASQVISDKALCNVSGRTIAQPSGVMCGPDLHVRKIGAPDPVEAGRCITYTISLSNTGGSAATNVIVTDVLDVHVHFSGSLPPPRGGGGAVWTWEFAKLRVGCPVSIVVTGTVASPLTNSLPLTNVVYAISQETAVTLTTEVVMVCSSSILGINETDSPDPVAPGGLLTYTIVYSNSGNADATGVYVQEIYDRLTCFERSNPPPDNHQDGSCSSDHNNRWTLGALPGDGKNHFITVTVSVSDSTALVGRVLSSTVALYSHEGSTDSATITTEVKAPILGVNETDSPDPVAPGGLLTYTIIYSNSGNVDATGVYVQEVYDHLTCFKWSDPPPDNPKPGSCEPGDNNLWYHPGGALSADGNNHFITVTVTVSDSAALVRRVLSNTVALYSHEGPTGSVTITTEVKAPVLGVAKTDSPDPVAPGGLLTYTIVYSNSGSANATGVYVQEAYDGLTCFKRSDPPPDNPKPGSCEPGDNNLWYHPGGALPADGKNHFITVTVTVSGSVALVRVLSNTVSLDCLEVHAVSKTISTRVLSYIWLPLVTRNYCAPGPWWCPQNDQNLAGKTVFALAGCSDGTLFAGAEDGIYSRGSGDVQWQQERSTTGEVRGLAASSDCAVVYAAVLNEGILSRDGGSWPLVSTSDMSKARTVLLSGGKVLAGGDFGVSYTVVGPPHHWGSCNTPFNKYAVINLVRSDGQVYAAVWGRGVWRCNGYDCHNWEPMGLNKRYALYAIGSPTDGEPWLVGLNDGFYRWTGTTSKTEWESPQPWGNTRTFCFAIDGTTVYAGQAITGVLRSTDGGLTWEAMNSDWGPPSQVRALLIRVDGCGRRWLYAGTTEGVWRYLLHQPPPTAIPTKSPIPPRTRDPRASPRLRSLHR